jgi:hypothetical protein
VELEGTGCSVAKAENSLLIGKGPVTEDDGLHIMREIASAVYLTGGLHPVRLEWFNHLGNSGLEVEYEGPALRRQKIPDDTLFHYESQPLAGTARLTNGLRYQCWEGECLRLRDFSQRSPVKTGVVKNFDLRVRTRQEDVALQFSGYLNVAREGLYTFYLKSDDGSRLFVGENPPSLKVVGSNAPVEPLLLTFGQFPVEREECRWAQFEGTIAFADRQRDGLELELRSGSDSLRVVVINGDGLAPPILLHSRARVVGVCGGAIAGNGRTAPGTMLTLDRRDLQILEASPKVWGAYPVVPIQELLRRDTGTGSELVAHIAGRIRAVMPGRPLVLEDETGHVEVAAPLSPALAIGGQLEYLGIWRRQGTNLVCQDGVSRPVPIGEPPESAPLPRLTTIEEVRGLKREEAWRGYEVALRGVVTCSRPDLSFFVLQGSHQGIFVFGLAANGRPLPCRGEYWEVEGVTESGDFAPMVRARRARCLGTGRMPEPLHPSWDQLMNGSFDPQYAEIQGILTERVPGGILLLTQGGRIKVDLAGVTSEALERYEHTLIRLRGCLFAAWDAETHHVKAGEVRMFDMAIAAEELTPENLFAAPLKRAAELRLFDSQAGAFQRVRVAGQIVHRRGNEYRVLDGTNGLRFNARDAGRLQVGDLVEVSGFPEMGGASPILQEAAVRKVGQAPFAEPTRLEPTDLVREALDSTPVRIQAVLIQVRDEPDEHVLQLQAGLQTFLARLSDRTASWAPIPLGSRLELTGIYALPEAKRPLPQAVSSFDAFYPHRNKRNPNRIKVIELF